jgi:hypothetical protein
MVDSRRLFYVASVEALKTSMMITHEARIGHLAFEIDEPLHYQRRLPTGLGQV